MSIESMVLFRCDTPECRAFRQGPHIWDVMDNGWAHYQLPDGGTLDLCPDHRGEAGRTKRVGDLLDGLLDYEDRLTGAYRVLRDSAELASGVPESARLFAKAEGVNLAIDYLRPIMMLIKSRELTDGQ